MKGKWIFLSVLITATNSIAYSAPAAIKTGFYAGLGMNTLTHADTIELSNWSNHYVFFTGPDNGNNPGFAFLLGYQYLIRNFILSANGAYRYFIGPPSASVKLNAIDTPRVTTNSNFGLELRPGILIAPNASLFGIVGFETTFYKVNHLFNQTNTAFSGWQNGLGLGVGCNIAFSSAFLLQFDYLYTRYRNLNYTDHVSKVNAALNPTTNIFSLGINYQI